MTSAKLTFTGWGTKIRPIWLLLLLIVLCDLLLWQVMPGLGFAAFFLAVAAAAHALCFADVPRRRALIAWAALIVALIPAFDLVQALSVGFAMAGLLGFAALMVTADSTQLTRIMARLPWQGAAQELRDIAATARGQVAGSRISATGLLRDWGVPLVLGFVFLMLFAVANPFLDEWLSSILQGRFDFLPRLDRVIFWLIIAALCWPFLRLVPMRSSLTARRISQPRAPKGWLINPRSVTRGLILFNLMFAAQSVSDIAVFSGGVALPEGMSFAAYAHRGAYPLLVTALLAGGFAVAAQPWLAGRNDLRALLMVWVAQNVLLVATSMLRLDLYVDAYGLTRLRVAAFIWMFVVAAGLCLMIWQLVRALPVRWMLVRSALLGMTVLYAMSLTNVAGLVARHNLARDDANLDGFYLCQIGEGAKPAVLAYELANDTTYCYSDQIYLRTPRDLREWGYRNYRLRRNVATLMEGAETWRRF